MKLPKRSRWRYLHDAGFHTPRDRPGGTAVLFVVRALVAVLTLKRDALTAFDMLRPQAAYRPVVFDP
jgi:hypothetical protein